VTSNHPFKPTINQTFHINYNVEFNDNSLINSYGNISNTDKKITWKKNKIIPEYFSLNEFPGVQAHPQLNNEIGKPIRCSGGSHSDLKFKGNLDKLIEYSNGFFNSISRLIYSYHLVYAIRGMEEQPFPLGEKPSESLELIDLYERSDALASTLAYNREMQEELSSWFKKLMKVDCSVELVPSRKVAIRIKSQKAMHPIVNEGMGLNQLLYLLIPIALAKKNHTVFMEGPEVHLHPKAQSKLVDFLLKIHKAENKQYMIATHSEHILFGFLTALAKGKITLDDLAIYYFENKNGKAEVTTVKVHENGTVTGGLPGFFEHSVDELITHLEAMDPRKKDEV